MITYLLFIHNVQWTCLERPYHLLYKCGLSRQVIFGDRPIYLELLDLLPGISGLSRQKVFHGSGEGFTVVFNQGYNIIVTSTSNIILLLIS